MKNVWTICGCGRLQRPFSTRLQHGIGTKMSSPKQSWSYHPSILSEISAIILFTKIIYFQREESNFLLQCQPLIMSWVSDMTFKHILQSSLFYHYSEVDVRSRLCVLHLPSKKCDFSIIFRTRVSAENRSTRISSLVLFESTEDQKKTNTGGQFKCSDFELTHC